MVEQSTDPVARRRRDRYWSALLVFGVLAALWLIRTTLQDRGEPVNLEQTLDSLRFLRNATWAGAVLVLGTGLALARLLLRVGNATRDQERFPPEGTAQLLDAAPRKGVAALYLARNLRLAGIACAILSVALFATGIVVGLRTIAW